MIITLTRVGKFEGNFGEAVKRFSPNFVRLTDPLDISEKYGLYEDNQAAYFLMVSKGRHGEHPVYHYNTILTVTSESKERNEEVARAFEEKTKLSLRAAPDSLARMMQEMDGPFSVLKRHGEKALEFLKDMEA